MNPRRTRVPFAVLVLNVARPKTPKELEPYILALEDEARESEDAETATRCLQSAVILEQHRRKLEKTSVGVEVSARPSSRTRSGQDR